MKDYAEIALEAQANFNPEGTSRLPIDAVVDALLAEFRKRELTAALARVRVLEGALKRAEQLAEIAYDWDLGDDGKVSIDGQWTSCADLRTEFKEALNQSTES